MLLVKGRQFEYQTNRDSIVNVLYNTDANKNGKNGTRNIAQWPKGLEGQKRRKNDKICSLHFITIKTSNKQMITNYKPQNKNIIDSFKTKRANQFI